MAMRKVSATGRNWRGPAGTAAPRPGSRPSDGVAADAAIASSRMRSLSGIGLFRELSAPALAEIERRCRWRTFEAGEQIISHEDASDEVCFLVDGNARVVIYSAAGKAVTFRDVGPGGLFGELAAIDGKPRSASIEALGPCLVASLSSAVFRELLERHPELARVVQQHLVTMIRLLTDRVFEFSTLAVANRIQAELLRLARGARREGRGARIVPAPKHMEIAERISTHREAVAREMSRLARLGVIERQGGALAVNDLARLQRMVEEAAGE